MNSGENRTPSEPPIGTPRVASEDAKIKVLEGQKEMSKRVKKVVERKADLRAKRIPIGENPLFRPNGSFLDELQQFLKGINELDAIALNATVDTNISQFQLSDNRRKMTLSLLNRLNEDEDVTLTEREVEAILRIWLRTPIRMNVKKARQNYSPAQDDFIRTRAASVLVMLNEGRNVTAIMDSMQRPVTMDVEDLDNGGDVCAGEYEDAVYNGPMNANDRDPDLLMTEMCRLFYRAGISHVGKVA